VPPEYAAEFPVTCAKSIVSRRQPRHYPRQRRARLDHQRRPRRGEVDRGSARPGNRPVIDDRSTGPGQNDANRATQNLPAAHVGEGATSSK